MHIIVECASIESKFVEQYLHYSYHDTIPCSLYLSFINVSSFTTVAVFCSLSIALYKPIHYHNALSYSLQCLMVSLRVFLYSSTYKYCDIKLLVLLLFCLLFMNSIITTVTITKQTITKMTTPITAIIAIMNDFSCAALS